MKILLSYSSDGLRKDMSCLWRRLLICLMKGMSLFRWLEANGHWYMSAGRLCWVLYNCKLSFKTVLVIPEVRRWIRLLVIWFCSSRSWMSKMFIFSLGS